jgi:glycosyltransferase involved in cell wall biosynthesis
VQETPAKITYHVAAARGKLAFVRHALRAAAAGRFDGVICGHVHLMPLAWYLARRLNVPVALIVHGIEAWKRPRNWLTGQFVRRSDAVVSVSEFTRQRFLGWTSLQSDRAFVVPNCVQENRFGPGDKRADLLSRYGLTDRVILLTVGRLAGAERYKGFDEVIEVLPALAREIPTISYLIVGEGQDQDRLERKARRLGVRDRVVFAGYVPESEKADHYRLANAFVMPSRGEGFGIVYLEALACGVPVVASSEDAGREAILDGAMGELVDPGRPEEIVAAVRRALARPRVVPEELGYFSAAEFTTRWHAVVDRVFVS